MGCLCFGPTLRSRLTLWYAVLLGVPLAVFAVVCYVVLARTLVNRTDRFIGEALTVFSAEVLAERRQKVSVREALVTTADEVCFATSGSLCVIRPGRSWRCTRMPTLHGILAATAYSLPCAATTQCPRRGRYPGLTAATGW